MVIKVIEPLSIKEEYFLCNLKDKLTDKHEIVYYDTRPTSDEEIISRASDTEIMVVANLPINKTVLTACKKLKFIAVAFTGLDHIDLDYCQKNDIEVKNAAGYATNAVADQAVGMAVSLLRKLKHNDLRTRNLEGRNGYLGKEIAECKVGIVATGAIGIQTAKIFQVMGAEVLCWSRSEKEEIKQLGMSYVSLEELFSECDVISLHICLGNNHRKIPC